MIQTHRVSCRVAQAREARTQEGVVVVAATPRGRTRLDRARILAGLTQVGRTLRDPIRGAAAEATVAVGAPVEDEATAVLRASVRFDDGDGAGPAPPLTLPTTRGRGHDRTHARCRAPALVHSPGPARLLPDRGHSDRVRVLLSQGRMGGEDPGRDPFLARIRMTLGRHLHREDRAVEIDRHLTQDPGRRLLSPVGKGVSTRAVLSVI